MADPAELQAKLKALSDNYAAQLPEKLRQLKHAWDQLSKTIWIEDEFQALHRMVHTLTGSGRTFGFPALSDAARNLENYLKPLGDAKQLLTGEQRDRVSYLLGELDRAAFPMGMAPAVQSASISATPSNTSTGMSRKVFVVEDDPVLAEELKIQLSYFGYHVSIFHMLSEFRAAIQNCSDAVVLMNVNFSGKDREGIHTMAALQQERDVPIPVIFLSARNELDVRLDAVRAGGIAYLSLPVNIGILVDKLDALTSTQIAAAYRVLIVDDSVELTNYFASALEQAGMLVCAVNEPLKVLEPLLEFSPDLILIDMYMPECSGMELARIIRQLDAFVSIPIVFLSAESNLDTQLSALGLGGDDFLTKPIGAAHLISSVTSRIRRSLVLRSFMVRDSLTGLLNHTAIKSQLAHEMVRAKRQGKPLAFAMVDIDHFKAVNDTYGHPAGDRVIKSISRLLKQRLRENDLVGRYGGEEFAVVLVDTDAPTALKILDNIRNDFSLLRHMADDHEFFATFSCGIADITNYSDASKLADAADKALYKAKFAGRNRIVLADTLTPDSLI